MSQHCSGGKRRRENEGLAQHVDEKKEGGEGNVDLRTSERERWGARRGGRELVKRPWEDEKEEDRVEENDRGKKGNEATKSQGRAVRPGGEGDAVSMSLSIRDG